MEKKGNLAPAFRTTGVTWLSSVSDQVGIPLDQVNFIACQLFGLVAAFWFRIYLSPRHATPRTRHAVALSLGASLLWFCFGWYAAHVFILALICYGIMITASVHNVHKYTMVVSLGYLTVCQVLRVFIFDYGVLSTDFSGPLMMMTQKITSLAFQLHDGMGRKQEELKDDQRRLAVRSRPSLLEYLSYNINFMSVLVGPCSNYKDYDEFINGKGVIRRLKAETDGIVQQNCKVHEPSPTVRRNFRHYFLSSIQLKLCYDVMTWAATQLTISYTVMPFLLLAVDPALQYYRSMFFHVHVLSILALILLPSKPSSRKPEKPTLLSNNNMKEG